MVAIGSPAVKFPIKYAKKLNSFSLIFPFAIIFPDKINIGTAKIGKLSTPFIIERIIYGAFAGNIESNIFGKIPEIANTIPIGIPTTIKTINIKNNTPIVIFPLLYFWYKTPSFCSNFIFPLTKCERF